MKFGEPIAIVGMGGVLPGARSLEDFWRMVESGTDSSRSAPPGRWRLQANAVLHPTPGTPDRVYTDRACFVEGFQFDPTGYALPPEFLAAMDPAVQLVLSAGREAMRGARLDATQPSRMGVVMGHIALPTERCSALAEEYLTTRWQAEVEGLPSPAGRPHFPASPTHPLNRYVAGLPAGLLAQALGLGGGARALDAACASSLYAFKLACDELQSGRADAMLAGGASRPDSLYTQMGFAQLRALATSGRCTPFDAAASGLIVGEGAGLVVLKRLADALRDGDTIHALIRGIGLSNDLEGNLLSPSSEGQLRALRLAYEAAGWDPESVEFIECHATGTPVGDAVEFASLSQLWAGRPWQPGQCALGAVKANIGHLLTGAGAASLLKVLLALRHRTIPPVANFRTPSGKIPLAASPFRAPTQSQPWPERPDGQPRRAAINGFGFGGINAHLLLEEWTGSASQVRPRPKSAARVEKNHGGLPSGESPVPVAIIGMAAHVGPWKDLAALAARCLGEVDATEPQARPAWRGLASGEVGGQPGFYVEDLALPVNRFRIPPRELAELLPQQALMLEVAAQALSDAQVARPEPTRAGVFVGLGLDLRTTDFHFRWCMLERVAEWAHALPTNISEPARTEWMTRMIEAAGPPLTADRTMGALAGTNASRIGKEFHLGGQCYTVSSEDTSALSALEVAVRALQRGELDLAVVGGVELGGDLRALLAQEALGQPGIPGEGAVAVVLKRLPDALSQRDRIYAAVRGLGVATIPATSDGASVAATLAAERAQQEAGVTPESISWCEGSAPRPKREDAAVGSGLDSDARQQVGNTGAASGLVGLAKAALALHAEWLPAGPNRRPQYWLRDRCEGPRRVSVAAHGVGGQAVHVVLEGVEPPEVPSAERAAALTRVPVTRRDDALFLLAADGVDGLPAALEALRSWSAAHAELSLDSLARLWWARRAAASNANPPATMALIAQDAAQLQRLLAAAQTWLRTGQPPSLDHRDRDRLFFTPPPERVGGRVAFVFPGAGNHFPDMGRELGLLFPDVLRAQDQANQRLASQLFAGRFWNQTTPVQDQRVSICGQVALGAFVSDIAVSLGLRPAAAIGYSLGECTALFALRAWQARDDMLERVMASSLFTRDLTGQPEMLRAAWKLSAQEPVSWLAGLVDRPAEQVRAAQAEFPRTYVLIVNAPQECVIGGEATQVRALVRQLGCHFFPLEGVSTVHCELLRPFVEPYRAMHRFPTTPPEGVTFYSAGWGRAYQPDQAAAAEAIVAQASATVDFPRVIEAAYREGVRCFVEMGPGASCSRMIDQILEGRPHVARSLCVSAKEPLLDLLRALAALWAEGVAVDLRPLYPPVREKPTSEPAVRQVAISIAGPSMAPPAVPRAEPTAVKPNRIFPTAAPSTLLAAEGSAATAPDDASTLDPFELELIASMAQTQEKTLQAHGTYLAFAEGLSRTLTEAVQAQFGLIRQVAPGGMTWEPAAPVAAEPVAMPRSLNRAQCLEFAIGKIGRVLGPAFAEVDSYPTRVRLPDEPLMLVDRILTIEGEPRSMTQGRVVTEHDVKAGAWYLDCGRIPTCIAVEAGQADLFLSGFLGIDFQTRGLSVYRLLDARVCFHRSLPGPGEVIHYDIHIDRFFRQGDTWLFRFRFESTVNGEPLLTMTEGCAGFFSAEELASGKGVVRTALQLRAQPGQRPADWVDFVPMAAESFSEAQLDLLRGGDLAGCFGGRFRGLALRQPVTLPGGRMRLVHRIERLEPAGGRFGLGLIRGEADIHPDDWFLTCHFSDDRVMPGTLMYECCLHTLRVFLLRLGWVTEAGPGIALEPVPGVVGQLKCRGQVLETTRLVTYEIEIKEIGYRPEPYVIADALMYADGKAIVEIGAMSLRYTGVTREMLQATWQAAARPAVESDARAPRRVLYGPERIRAFAVGNPSEAFGEPYRVFDAQRRIARLPGPPYQFLDRIVDIQGCTAFRMEAGGVVTAEYDVPPDEWYFAANRQSDMPFAVLLEIALQPCGWLSAYMGSALTSTEDLAYRNLGGTGAQFVPVRPGVGTLTTTVKSTRLSSSAGMIIQWFDFAVRAGDVLVYQGDTYFGFFPKAALEKQEGIREAAVYQPTAAEIARAQSLPFPKEQPFPADTLRMVDEIPLWVPDGAQGHGLLRGTKRVVADEWFFQAHFYQDPVVPGSLGLESFLQLLKFAAVRRWGHAPGRRWEAVAMDTRHEWVYRGQVIPRDQLVTVDAVVTAVDDATRTLTGAGFLSVDGRVIYGMKNFVVRAVEEAAT